MTLRLSVDRTAWDAHVDAVATAVGPRLVPVVKGNGYGLTRRWLAGRAAALSSRVAVGTVWEAADVPAGCEPLVLTPALHLPDDLRSDAVFTVGADAHVDVLRRHGFAGRVVVKLRSSMGRYGAGRGQVSSLADAAGRAGLEVGGFALHLPIAGTDDDRLAEIEQWLDHLPAGAPLAVSHLEPRAFDALVRRHPERPWSLRLGTWLWHGDKSALHLEADVVDRRAIASGATAGYRLGTADSGGDLLLIGAGTAHGVTPLPDGRSPFHFARRRLPLHEAPHMHTSMVVVGDGEPVPEVGDWVDVQRPLTAIVADVVDWT